MQFSHLEISCEQFTLDNGLSVIVHEDHKTPIVAVNVWYHVGSKNEKPGRTGLAHLFEHLMFGGSEHLQGSYIESMEKIGATDLNGTTSEDRTNYFQNVPASALDYALFAESDRMGYFYNTITQDLLDLQRGVVQNEKRQHENLPYAIVEDLVVKSTYPAGHPYAHTIIGSMEDLESASLDDVRDWFRTYYTPSNAVLAIAGDITVDQAREKVNRYFAEIPPGPPVVHERSWIARMTGQHRESVQDRVPHARAYKIWNVPGYSSPVATYLRLAGGILSAGKTSRLHKRLVYDDQVATQVSAYLDEREIGSQFVVVATARDTKDLLRVERALDEEIARFCEEGPSARELQRMRIQSYASFVRGTERIGGFGGKSDILATNQTYLGSAAAYKQRLQQLEEVTPEVLREAAATWLSEGVYALEVLPFEAKKPAAPAPARSHVPEPGLPHDLRLPPFREDRLANGARLFVAERHDIPLVNVWLEFDGGYAADRFARLGAARLATSLLAGGTARRTALEISEELQMLAAQFSAGCNLDLCSVYLSTLRPTLDDSLALYSDIVLLPTFPEYDFEYQRKLQLASIAHEKATPVQMALRSLPPLLFGRDHPYAVPFTGSGTEDSLSQLRREDIAAFHSTWFKSASACFVVVGDTTLAEIKPKLENLFAAWAPGETPFKDLRPVPEPSKPVLYLLDKPGSQHSIVMAATLAPPPDARTEVVLETTNNIFGGTFGGRLNMNLREDKHWSYGAASILYEARAQRPFLTYASVQADKTADSIAEILKEFSGMAGARPVLPQELEKVKQQQIFELPGANEKMSSIGNLFSGLLQAGLPLDYYDSYVSRVSALTVDEIQACAKSLLDPERMLWLVVGDASELEPSLRKLGVGEIIPLSE
ncbi:MAG: insulinase family protein [Acidobacteriaceae bacterium]|nr:insulinase family protein [Acidobacteriaceae bacterium]